MTKKSLAQYLEFETNWNELRKLSDNHLAAVSVLQYAVSEVNVLRKVYLCQDHTLTGETATDSATNMHRFVILRTWSSRLFEAIEFIKGGHRKTFIKDPKLKALADEALADLEKISDGDGYETARDVRHEATNHYSFTAAKKNLMHVDGSMNFNMYLADKSGNEFFPMGEAVMFHARLNRRWQGHSEAQRNQRFYDWLRWNLKANDWLSNVHGSFVSNLVFENLARNSVRQKSYWVSPDFASNRTGKLTPIFFQHLN